MGRLPTYAFFFLFGYNKAKKKITSYNWFSFTIDVFSIIPFGMVESFLIGSRSGLKIQINYEMDFLMLYAHKLVKYYYVGSRSKETSRVLPFLSFRYVGACFDWCIPIGFTLRAREKKEVAWSSIKIPVVWLCCFTLTFRILHSKM